LAIENSQSYSASSIASSQDNCGAGSVPTIQSTSGVNAGVVLGVMTTVVLPVSMPLLVRCHCYLLTGGRCGLP
jgi:hypothetical protein